MNRELATLVYNYQVKVVITRIWRVFCHCYKADPVAHVLAQFSGQAFASGNPQWRSSLSHYCLRRTPLVLYVFNEMHTQYRASKEG